MAGFLCSVVRILHEYYGDAAFTIFVAIIGIIRFIIPSSFSNTNIIELRVMF